MRQCIKCREVKDSSEFYSSYNKNVGKTYIRTICMECEKERQRNIKRNPYETRRKNLKALYGITPEQFDKMISGGCEVCGTHENLCIDHDHDCCSGRKTCGGCIRGVLCERHNKAEGFLRGSVEEAHALIKYMQKGESV